MMLFIRYTAGYACFEIVFQILLTIFSINNIFLSCILACTQIGLVRLQIEIKPRGFIVLQCTRAILVEHEVEHVWL